MQVAATRDALRATHAVRAVTLLPGDWAALLKTSREKFIVPHADLDAAAMRELEALEAMDGAESDAGDGVVPGGDMHGSGGVGGGGGAGSEAGADAAPPARMHVTGSPPQVRTPLHAHIVATNAAVCLKQRTG